MAKQDEFLHRNLHNTPAAICHSKCEEPSQGQRMALVELPPDDGEKYVNIPSEKYIYVHKYVYICVYTYLCKMDEHRSYAGLS